MAACGSGNVENCDDCVQLVRNTKTVQVPCTRNTYQKYQVEVPRQVRSQVPRTVTYTDYETRNKQVPYTVNRSERRIRMETQKYQVPVTKFYKRTVMETKERQVNVPYYTNIPETRYRTVMEKVPVQRTKIQMEDRVKTVWDTQIRTRCVPETKIIRKQLPVYNVVARHAAEPNCSGTVATGVGAVTHYGQMVNDGDWKSNDNAVAYTAADINMDQISYPQASYAPVMGINANKVAFTGTGTRMDSHISYPSYQVSAPFGTAANNVAFTTADIKMDGQNCHPCASVDPVNIANSGVKYVQ